MVIIEDPYDWPMLIASAAAALATVGLLFAAVRAWRTTKEEIALADGQHRAELARLDERLTLVRKNHREQLDELEKTRKLSVRPMLVANRATTWVDDGTRHFGVLVENIGLGPARPILFSGWIVNSAFVEETLRSEVEVEHLEDLGDWSSSSKELIARWTEVDLERPDLILAHQGLASGGVIDASNERSLSVARGELKRGEPPAAPLMLVRLRYRDAYDEWFDERLTLALLLDRSTEPAS